jgi:type II secretory pathway pseudopilin PulG
MQNKSLHSWLKLALIQQLQQLKQARSQGFTLLDVIVAIVVLTTFTSVAMTAMSSAMLLKVRARNTAEATNWIQQDLETVRNAAAQFSYTLASDAAAGQPNIVLVTNPGLTVGEQISVGTDATIYKIHSVSGTSIQLTTNLRYAQSASARVLAVSKCNATTSSAGFATVFGQHLPSLANGGTRTISGKTYILERQSSAGSSRPFGALNLTYTVKLQGSSTPLTTMYTEVIPNAVFQCPGVQ